jgi:hypothetical protein
MSSFPVVLPKTFPHFAAQGEFSFAFRALLEDMKYAMRASAGETSEGRIFNQSAVSEG